ncbi:NUDIX domain-containing protein [Nonomuraea wenchangensis]
MMRPARDYVGVGVGAVISNDQGQVFLALRGPRARNETGTWEFPGGMVHFGEALEQAITREIAEEYGMDIHVTGQLGAFDHILPDQHWVSVTFYARHLGGEPVIREPGKCEAIGWFDIEDLPRPLSEITKSNLAKLERR